MKQEHVPLFLASILVTVTVTIIWVRTGLVPAASGGDEVWWSESAYNFLHEGVLRWSCLSDDKGSGTMSFWPPVIAFLQAAMMKVFGVTAFGIYAQSSLVCTLMMVVVYLLSRSLQLNRAASLLCSCAIFGVFLVGRRMTQVRMENLTALASVTIAWLLNIAGSASTYMRFILAASAGLVAGVGIFCYYPQTPFLLLACGVTLLTAPRVSVLAIATGLFIGIIPPLLMGLAWIAPHWQMFSDQVLRTGTDDYISLSNLISPFIQLGSVSNLGDWIQQVEKWSLLLLGMLVCFFAPQRQLRLVGAMTLCSSLPMFAYAISPQVSAGVLGVPLFFGLARLDHSYWVTRIYLVGKWYLVVVAATNMILIAETAWYQRDGRRYEPIATALRTAVRADVPTAISQRAWLGLREVCSSENLHLLVYSGPSLNNMPLRARRPDADNYFQYLVIERPNIEILMQIYPWLRRGIETAQYHVVAEIRPEFKFLPWANLRCYDLVVYERTERLVQFPTLHDCAFSGVSDGSYRAASLLR
jgi:hypothetical protein